MPFPRQTAVTVTAVAITDIRITLYSHDPAGGEPSEVTYEIDVRQSDGSIQTKRGDLLEHMTPAQKGTMTTFMNNMRDKAVSEFLT